MTIGYNRLNPAVATPREVASAVNLLIDGKSNNRGTFTLAANATTTTVTDLRSGSESVILFTPMTATAAAENGPGPRRGGGDTVASKAPGVERRDVWAGGAPRLRHPYRL